MCKFQYIIINVGKHRMAYRSPFVFWLTLCSPEHVQVLLVTLGVLSATHALMKVQLLPISSDDSASSTVSGTGSEITGPSEVFATDVVSLRVRLYQDLPTIALHTIPISSS